MNTLQRNFGALNTVKRAAANTAATAGGTGDNTEVTGVIIDRAALGWPKSAVLVIPFTATLAATETLQIAVSVKEGEASNLSDAAVLKAVAATTVATGPGGGGTVTGEYEVELNLEGAGRYIRADWTPNLSRANTDTAALSAVLSFGPGERI